MTITGWAIKSREDTNMNARYSKILASLLIITSGACWGYSVSDSDDVSVDTTVDYDIATTLSGTPAVAGTGSITGTEAVESVWTYSGIISSKYALANSPRSRIPANLLRPLSGH